MVSCGSGGHYEPVLYGVVRKAEPIVFSFFRDLGFVKNGE